MNKPNELSVRTGVRFMRPKPLPWLVAGVAMGLFGLLMPSVASAGTLYVLPANTRYFTDGSGNAVYLTGSHSWNNFQDWAATDPPPAFGFNAYLDLLVNQNQNFIRLWAWEAPRWAPWTSGDLYISPMPYQRPGPGTALDGKPKFDVNQFNQAYFDRLRRLRHRRARQGHIRQHHAVRGLVGGNKTGLAWKSVAKPSL